MPSCIYEWQCFLCYSCFVLKDQWGSIFNSYCQSWLHKDTSWTFFGLITQLLTMTSTVYTSVHPQWLQSNSAKQLQSECKTQTGVNNKQLPWVTMLALNLCKEHALLSFLYLQTDQLNLKWLDPGLPMILKIIIKVIEWNIKHDEIPRQLDNAKQV